MQQTGLCQNLKTVTQGEALKQAWHRKKGSGICDSDKHLNAGDTGKQKDPTACDVSKETLHLGIIASYVLQRKRRGELAQYTCLRSHKENHPLRML